MKMKGGKGQAKSSQIYSTLFRESGFYVYSFFEGLQQFVMQKQKSGLAPLFLIFLVLAQQTAWQGYGQVNRTVVDTIMGYINTNVSQHTGDSSYDAFNTAFSTELDRRWDPAWNVFTIKTTSSYDTVCYGYAFRNQWMWFNDYRVNGVVLAFVVWKDYNCQGWKTVGKNGVPTGYSSQRVQGIASDAFGLPYAISDLWNAGKDFAEGFNTFVQSHSIVVSQDIDSDIYGRVCMVDNIAFYSKNDYPAMKPFKDGSTIWGNLLLFRTK